MNQDFCLVDRIVEINASNLWREGEKKEKESIVKLISEAVRWSGKGHFWAMDSIQKLKENVWRIILAKTWKWSGKENCSSLRNALVSTPHCWVLIRFLWIQIPLRAQTGFVFGLRSYIKLYHTQYRLLSITGVPSHAPSSLYCSGNFIGVNKSTVNMAKRHTHQKCLQRSLKFEVFIPLLRTSLILIENVLLVKSRSLKWF